MLTSFILVIEDTSLSILVVFVLSLLNMVYVREALPHANNTTSIYVYMLNWQLLAFILVLLVVSVGVTKSSAGLTALSISLMLSNIAAVPMAFTGRMPRTSNMRASKPTF